MKRLWMAVLLLAALLSLCLVNAWYSLTLTQQLSGQLNQAQALVEQDQWEQARSITQEVYHSWNGHHFYLHVFLRHSDTDQILRTFRQVIQYLDLEELDQYVAGAAVRNGAALPGQYFVKFLSICLYLQDFKSKISKISQFQIDDCPSLGL